MIAAACLAVSNFHHTNEGPGGHSFRTFGPIPFFDFYSNDEWSIRWKWPKSLTLTFDSAPPNKGSEIPNAVK
jgi:hypothetical protein